MEVCVPIGKPAVWSDLASYLWNLRRSKLSIVVVEHRGRAAQAVNSSRRPSCRNS